MTIGSRRGFPRHFESLFDTGPAGDLADGALLDRFVSDGDETAFEVIVARHGPMVLRICRAALSEPHDIDDAFQAVFVVLVGQARSIRSRGSIASWLFGVATRVSARVRVDAARRRGHEKAAAVLERVDPPPDPHDPPLAESALHEELTRLPERYRETILLCYFEGQTCDAAARRLNRPVGTIKARLCRAREILRKRLIRRGVAPSAALLVLGTSGGTSAAIAPVPAALSRMAVAVACRAPTQAGAVSARVLLLTKGMVGTMYLQNLAFAATLAIPIALVAGYGSMQPREDPAPQAKSRLKPPPVYRPLVTKAALSNPVDIALNDALVAGAGEADPYYFTFALIRLANARNKASDHDGALTAFRLADQIADTVKNQHLRKLALMRTAVARARIGDKAPARATLDHFAREAAALGPSGRYELMSMVIDFLDEAGFKTEAQASLEAELAIVNAIDDESLRDGGIYRLFFSQLTLGDYDGALRQVERYTGAKTNHRQPLLQAIVNYNASRPDRLPPRRVVERAVELASEITFPYPRALAQAQIVAGLARAGDVEGALNLARAIGSNDDGPLRQGILAEIPGALADIARVQAQRGDVAGAKSTLREALAIASTNTDRGGVLFDRVRRVAEAAAEIGDVEAARAAADAIDDDVMEKSLALAALARAQSKAGDAAGARATLAADHEQAKQVGARPNLVNDNPTANSDEAFQNLVLAQAKAGDAKGAVAIAKGRGSDEWKSGVLAAIAPMQAQKGDIAGALETARAIPTQARAGEAYCDIASIQTVTSGPEAVLAWAREVQPLPARAFALIGVAEAVAKRKVAKAAETPSPR